jgi:hypothetical protein
MTTFRCLRTWSAFDPNSARGSMLSREFTAGEEHTAPEWIARILARAKPAYVVIVGKPQEELTAAEFELVSQA